MIVFDLRCGADHVFEAWFASSSAFEDQRGRGLIACPTCGDTGVDKAVMAPRLSVSNGDGVAPLEAMKAMLRAVAEAQAKSLKDSRWVGRRFAEEARAIHAGEREEAVIHGQATADEARALVDDGVPVMPLLVPVVPPEALN